MTEQDYKELEEKYFLNKLRFSEPYEEIDEYGIKTEQFDMVFTTSFSLNKEHYVYENTVDGLSSFTASELYELLKRKLPAILQKHDLIN